MKDALALLTLVIIIAAWEIRSALKDIREALRTMGAPVGEKMDTVVGELDRISGILGGILASMPSPPSEPQLRSDWDRLRASLGVKKLGAK